MTGFTDEAFDLPHTMAAAILDIKALRQFRVMNLNSNWMKDLRTEVFRKMIVWAANKKSVGFIRQSTLSDS